MILNSKFSKESFEKPLEPGQIVVTVGQDKIREVDARGDLVPYLPVQKQGYALQIMLWNVIAIVVGVVAFLAWRYYRRYSKTR